MILNIYHNKRIFLMNKFLIITFGVASSMLLMDIIWLSVMSKKLYRPYLGDMIAEKFRLLPAVIFYLIYVLGLVYFVSLPAARQMSFSDSIIDGGLFGAIAYSTYDLTNFATFEDVELPDGFRIIHCQFGTKYKNVMISDVKKNHHQLEQLGVAKEGLTAYLYWGNPLLEDKPADIRKAL